jgi:hypothetical protein
MSNANLNSVTHDDPPPKRRLSFQRWLELTAGLWLIPMGYLCFFHNTVFNGLLLLNIAAIIVYFTVSFFRRRTAQRGSDRALQRTANLG